MHCSAIKTHKLTKITIKIENPEPQEVKELRGLPVGGVTVASGGIYGMKKFSKQEIEAAVRRGLALELSPIRALGTSLGRNTQSQFCKILYSFQIKYL